MAKKESSSKKKSEVKHSGDLLIKEVDRNAIVRWLDKTNLPHNSVREIISLMMSLKPLKK